MKNTAKLVFIQKIRFPEFSRNLLSFQRNRISEFYPNVVRDKFKTLREKKAEEGSTLHFYIQSAMLL